MNKVKFLAIAIVTLHTSAEHLGLAPVQCLFDDLGTVLQDVLGKGGFKTPVGFLKLIDGFVAAQIESVDDAIKATWALNDFASSAGLNDILDTDEAGKHIFGILIQCRERADSWSGAIPRCSAGKPFYVHSSALTESLETIGKRLEHYRKAVLGMIALAGTLGMEDHEITKDEWEMTILQADTAIAIDMTH